MRRDQLEHAIRAACQIIDADEVIVVGSQAILGSLSEDQLPPEATMSLEVDNPADRARRGHDRRARRPDRRGGR
jgi:hypothetical protein